jgi:2-polyprenyl-3-methyl-5-hydroxy-6-metoxy-1,4-benzoquinol methylase
MEPLLQIKRVLREHPYSRELYASLANGWARTQIAICEVTSGRYHTAARFDRLFKKTPDPWRYAGSPISERRHQLILDTLSGRRYTRLLEIGCAEGWITHSLATRADELVAADISSVALARARHACCEHRNVQFVHFDLLTDPVAGFFDCIVCAGVLVYLPMSAQQSVRDRLVASIAPGGDLLLEHLRDASPGEVAGNKIQALYRNHSKLTVLSHQEVEDYAITLLRKVAE